MEENLPRRGISAGVISKGDMKRGREKRAKLCEREGIKKKGNLKLQENKRDKTSGTKGTLRYHEREKNLILKGTVLRKLMWVKSGIN